MRASEHQGADILSAECLVDWSKEADTECAPRYSPQGATSLNPHWDHLIAALPWLLDRNAIGKIGTSNPPGYWEPASEAFATLFPTLEQVLRKAFVTPIDLNGSGYVLFTWQRKEVEFCSWLSPAPSVDPPTSLYADHQVLLASFGGIVERCNEPNWWVLNHYDVLTEVEARCDATFIRYSAWAFEEASVEIPIDLKQFYSIAREANGNTTLCHRASGETLLFATDHAFNHVEMLPGCPEYTLYRLLGAQSFRDWVDTIARQWRDWVA